MMGKAPPFWVKNFRFCAIERLLLVNLAIFHLILSKLLIPNNHPMPLQVAIVRQPFIRINMRINQFPFHSTPFHQQPILIQFIIDIHMVRVDHLLQPQSKMWRRPKRSRA